MRGKYDIDEELCFWTHQQTAPRLPVWDAGKTRTENCSRRQRVVWEVGA